MSDDKITTLPVKQRPDKGHLMLVPPTENTCNHWPSQFEVDANAAKCRCKKCGAEVSAMFVLERLMLDESRWNQTREAYQDEMKRLKERSRTKCDHCGKMTRVSNR